MLTAEHTQSPTDFRQKATETLDRLNRTGEAEILTINGQARAVLLSPATYDEMAREVELSRDVTMMRQAVREIAEGKGRPARELFDELEAELAAMTPAGQNGADR